MAHSCRNQFVHLMWATKNLKPLIIDDPKTSLLPYLSGTIKNLGGSLLIGSEASNHIHLLVNSPVDLSIAEFLQKIKSLSSKWYRERVEIDAKFNWNEGYSAYTVSTNSIEHVNNYFSTESHRHQTLSFDNELIRFLKLHEINFNPKYVSCTTYTQLNLHLIWAVKHRSSLLDKSIRPLLFQKIRQDAIAKGCTIHAIDGIEDHIHVLLECPNIISTASLVQMLKTSSTHFIKSFDKIFSNFGWQEGYGVFSIGRPALESVKNYVNNQEEHHKCKSFDQEWAEFLQKVSFLA